MKRSLVFLPLVILMAFTLGCQDQQALAELEEMKAQAEVEEENIELVRKVLEAWSRGDVEAFEELVTPDYAFYYPSGNPNPMSREETIELLMMFRTSFPDITWSMEQIFAVGDEVIFSFIQRGTHEGEFQGIPATGNRVEGSGILITRIENGKVAEHREEFDMLGIMQQLGMELRPAAVEE
jgi:steroid delta-isomerase-like uncharacterized protein